MGAALGLKRKATPGLRHANPQPNPSPNPNPNPNRNPNPNPNPNPNQVPEETTNNRMELSAIIHALREVGT